MRRHRGGRALCRGADGDAASAARVHRALLADRAALPSDSFASLQLMRRPLTDRLSARGGRATRDTDPELLRTRATFRSPSISRKIFGDRELGGPAFRSRSATAAGPRPMRKYPYITRYARTVGASVYSEWAFRTGYSAWRTSRSRMSFDRKMRRSCGRFVACGAACSMFRCEPSAHHPGPASITARTPASVGCTRSR